MGWHHSLRRFRYPAVNVCAMFLNCKSDAFLFLVDLLLGLLVADFCVRLDIVCWTLLMLDTSCDDQLCL